MQFINDFLSGQWNWIVGMLPEAAKPYAMPGLVIFIVLNVTLGACSYLILLERKLSAWMQDRLGPNRVGPMGLLQPVADMLKLLLKEDVIPGHVNKFLFVLAPGISVFTTFLAFAVVPFGPVPKGLTAGDGQFPFIIAPGIDLGVVFIFAIGSLAVYGIILGGWASNNKYSALGCLRASAQVVSYEIPLGMSVVGLALLCGTMSIEKILLFQAERGIYGWNIWYQPLACVIFFIAAMAEAQRLPFDLAECEQELIGGWHTEYSAMKWGLFFLAEYTHVITISFLTSILFFGGWHLPFIAETTSNYSGVWMVKVGVLLAKVSVFIVVIQMLRWTIPRFRFDQLMSLAWLCLIPLAMVNIVMVMVVKQFELNEWWLLPGSAAIFLAAGLMGTQSTKPFARRVAAPIETPGHGGHGHAHAH
ncbi:MAG: NADH-quinone oxidoreductase subunit NuoH [Planctomycetales bacterium]|nr:NADH-quinone oxidoreductase subunit NuoH [Planctomycetales bacterium]